MPNDQQLSPEKKRTESERPEAERHTEARRVSSNESLDGMQDHTNQTLSARKDEEALRNNSNSDLLAQRGKLKLGIITKQFGCSVQIENGPEVVVKGFSADEVSKLSQATEARNSAEFIVKESNIQNIAAAALGKIMNAGSDFKALSAPAKPEPDYADYRYAGASPTSKVNPETHQQPIPEQLQQLAQNILNLNPFNHHERESADAQETKARTTDHNANKAEKLNPVLSLDSAQKDHALQRGRLLESLHHAVNDKKMDKAQESRIESSMNTFESNSKKQMTDLFQKSLLNDEQWNHDHQGLNNEQKLAAATRDAQALAEKQIADTYKAVGRLLEGNTKLNDPKLAMNVLEQVLNRAAHPEAIDQGAYNVCQSVSLERRLFSRTPAEAARLITDVVMTGKYESSYSHTSVKIDPKSIMSGDDNEATPRAEHRSFADHIFIETAANLYYQSSKNGERYQQDVRYIVNRRTGVADLPSDDRTNPGLDNNALYLLDKEIGHKHNEHPAAKTGWIFMGPMSAETGAQRTNSPEDMARKLQTALDKGQGPLILNVFYLNKETGSYAPHDLTIDSYKPGKFQGELPTFNLNNNWGASSDDKFESAYQVYDRLIHHKFPEMVNSEKKNDNGATHFNNDALQLRDLEEQHRAGKLSPKDYENALISQVEAIKIHCELYGAKRDQAAWQSVTSQLRKMQKTVPALSNAAGTIENFFRNKY